MRHVIARYPFDLTRTGVPALMKDVRPELVTGASVTIGRRHPVKQMDQVITRQDPRDFTAGDATRAMTRLGFTCHDRPGAAPGGVGGPAPFRTASALLGGTGPVAV
ncbi:SCO5918 family protein [Streptomyces sp. NPDC001410]|uniref:SCO5918 family protein n=1 Tax=Streptomyces sp. NPDC001410 TaxID=3364574 RepID=UPI00368CF14C